MIGDLVSLRAEQAQTEVGASPFGFLSRNGLSSQSN